MKIRVEVNKITYVLVGDKAKPQKLEQSIIEMYVDWFSVHGVRILGAAGYEKHYETFERNQHAKHTNTANRNKRNSSAEENHETYERNQHTKPTHRTNRNKRNVSAENVMNPTNGNNMPCLPTCVKAPWTGFSFVAVLNSVTIILGPDAEGGGLGKVFQKL